jgi:hypothetical protein
MAVHNRKASFLVGAFFKFYVNYTFLNQSLRVNFRVSINTFYPISFNVDSPSAESTAGLCKYSVNKVMHLLAVDSAHVLVRFKCKAFWPGYALSR